MSEILQNLELWPEILGSSPSFKTKIKNQNSLVLGYERTTRLVQWENKLSIQKPREKKKSATWFLVGLKMSFAIIMVLYKVDDLQLLSLIGDCSVYYV